MPRFLDIADWQIGRQFNQFPADDGLFHRDEHRQAQATREIFAASTRRCGIRFCGSPATLRRGATWARRREQSRLLPPSPAEDCSA
jgi:hypothetical protein